MVYYKEVLVLMEFKYASFVHAGDFFMFGLVHWVNFWNWIWDWIDLGELIDL